MKYYPSKFLGQIAFGLGLSLGALASVQAEPFTGNTTGAATYNRVAEKTNGEDPPVLLQPDALSGVGTAVPYRVFGVTVDTAGSYNFSITSATWDTFLTLYSVDGFNDANALQNVLIASDDSSSGFSNFSYILDASTSETMKKYFFVVSGFDNTEFGAFEGEVNGNGKITITDENPSPVPVPSSLALVGLGIWALRSRQK